MKASCMCPVGYPLLDDGRTCASGVWNSYVYMYVYFGFAVQMSIILQYIHVHVYLVCMKLSY